MYPPNYIPPYLAMVGNQLAWIGTVNLLVKQHAFQTTKEHFEKHGIKQPLKTQYAKAEKVDKTGKVVNLFGNKNNPN